VFGHAGQVEKVGDRAERQDQVIIFQFVRVMIESVRDGHAPSIDVDLVQIAAKEIDVTDHLADRINDVGQVKVAGGDFMQHGSE